MYLGVFGGIWMHGNQSWLESDIKFHIRSHFAAAAHLKVMMNLNWPSTIKIALDEFGCIWMNLDEWKSILV